MSDPIERQAAIEALLEKGQHSRRYKLGDIWELNFDEIREVINALPSAEPKSYRMGYQAGYAAAKRWIPCSEKGVEFPCLACDVFGQMFITKSGIVKVNGEYYDGDGFDFDNAEEFLKGKKVGRSMRMLPRKIVAWMPLPEPYRERR